MQEIKIIALIVYLCVYVCLAHRELSRIRDHDAFVSHQAERAHQQLAEAIDQTHSNTESVTPVGLN